MVRTSCRTAAKLFRALRRRETLLPVRPPPLRPLANNRKIPVSKAAPPTPEARSNEHLSAVHFTAGRHHPIDGGRPPCRLRRVPPVAGFRVAAGRLPDDPDSNVLSRRQS